MGKVRLNIEVSEDLVKLLDSLADEEVVTRTEIVRRALAVMKAYKDQIGIGNTHIGFAKEPGSLDAELIGVLTPTAPPQAESEKTISTRTTDKG